MEPIQNKPISDTTRSLLEVAAIGSVTITVASASLMLGAVPYIAGITVGAAILATPLLVIFPSVFAVLTLVLIVVLLASKPVKKRLSIRQLTPPFSAEEKLENNKTQARKILHDAADQACSCGRDQHGQFPENFDVFRFLRLRKHIEISYNLIKDDYTPPTIDDLLDERMGFGRYKNVTEDDPVFSTLVLPLVQLSLKNSSNFEEDYAQCTNVFFEDTKPTAAWKSTTKESLDSFVFSTTLKKEEVERQFNFSHADMLWWNSLDSSKFD